MRQTEKVAAQLQKERGPSPALISQLDGTSGERRAHYDRRARRLDDCGNSRAFRSSLRRPAEILRATVLADERTARVGGAQLW